MTETVPHDGRWLLGSEELTGTSSCVYRAVRHGVGPGFACRHVRIAAMPDRCRVADAFSAKARSDEIDPLSLPGTDGRVRLGIGCTAACDRRRMPD